jgi:RteC protein
MPGAKNDNKYYEDLYDAMEEQLGKDVNGAADGYIGALGLIRGRLGEVKARAIKGFGSLDAEIVYFRDVWPKFHGRYFYYLLLNRFALDKNVLPQVALPALIERMEGEAAAFFEQHREFWQDYRNGSPLISRQFTKEYSAASVFDPLWPSLDHQKVTLASYYSARGLAYEAFLGYLREPVLDQEAQYEFGGTDAEAREWLMELYANKVIRKKGGGHLNLSEYNRWYGYNFGKEFRKFFDKMSLLRNRKTDPLRFLHKRLRTAEQWMRERNAKD